ncbi:rhomboid family intramembrane serine protease [Marinomonas epiphytica]
MILIYRFQANEDPASLAKRLWEEKIPHQIVSDQEGEALWLNRASDLDYVQSLIRQWHDPAFIVDEVIRPKSNLQGQSIAWFIAHTPLTCLILAVTAIVAFITQLGENLDVIGYLSIVPFDIYGNRIHFQTLSQVVSDGQWWRFLTPSFLHFSVLHLIFNLLWVWELGRKIELLVGKLGWLLGFLTIGVASNLMQFSWEGYPLFGGLSGVVYGLVGFAWLMPMLLAKWPRLISKPLMAFFTIWLLVGYSPIPESIGLGNIANTAHLIGLVSGCMLSVLYFLFMKLRTR